MTTYRYILEIEVPDDGHTDDRHRMMGEDLEDFLCDCDFVENLKITPDKMPQ